MLISLAGGALGAGAVLLVVWVFNLREVVAFADDHAGLAGWVQAVGAVLALGALFLAQRLDHKNARNQRLEDAAERRKHAARASITAAKFLTAAVAAVAGFQEKTAKDKWAAGQVALFRTDVSAAIAILRDIDRGALPSEAAVVAVVNLLQAGHAADVLLNHVASQVEKGQSIGDPPFKSVRDGAEKGLSQLADAWIAAGVETL